MFSGHSAQPHLPSASLPDLQGILQQQWMFAALCASVPVPPSHLLKEIPGVSFKQARQNTHLHVQNLHISRCNHEIRTLHPDAEST
jgi:hypothetical protein